MLGDSKLHKKTCDQDNTEILKCVREKFLSCMRESICVKKI